MKYKFLIIDDNINFAKNLSNGLQQNLSNFVQKVDICNDGETGIKELIETKPDFLLLDLKLPKLNGLSILEKSKNMVCSIIVISGEVPLINHIRILDNSNVKKILIKPFPINILVNEINYICSEKIDDTFRKKIRKELSVFEFNIGCISYQYLVECLLLSCKHPYLLNNIEKDLFPRAAKILGVKNPQTIKWDIQKTIKSMIKYTEKQKVLKYFSRQTPSLKLFIATLSQSILNRK